MDVTLDESNGSQGHFDPNLVKNEAPPCEVIKKLVIGEVKPREDDDDDEDQPRVVAPVGNTTHNMPSQQDGDGELRLDDHPSMFDNPSPSRSAQQEELQVQINKITLQSRYVDEGVPSSPQDQQDDHEDSEPIQRQRDTPHPRVHQTIQRHHPVDNIL